MDNQLITFTHVSTNSSSWMKSAVTNLHVNKHLLNKTLSSALNHRPSVVTIYNAISDQTPLHYIANDTNCLSWRFITPAQNDNDFANHNITWYCQEELQRQLIHAWTASSRLYTTACKYFNEMNNNVIYSQVVMTGSCDKHR